MEMLKVVNVVPGFAKVSRRPIEMMIEQGFDVEELDYGLAGLNKDEPEFCRIVKGVDAIIVTAMDLVTRRIMENADRLKMIAIRSAGFEGTDLAAATDHGILVTHNPGSNSDPVADMAMGMMLAVSKRIGWMDRGMRDGKFQELRVNAKDIFKRTLGIIGLGTIGKKVAIRAQGFSMKVVYHDIIKYGDFENEHGVEKVSLDRLLSEADVITLHVPVDDSTRQMIAKPQIEKMKSGVILVNTCRGGVVDEQAVYDGLVGNHLYGYGTDVHEEEPPKFMELLRHEHVVSAPHVAGISADGLNNMAMLTAGKVIEFFKKGEIPENVLNPEVLTKLRR
jgi:D-3-phosphoglycerate dehydrogenase / 2-oxoglutarate reductase